MPAVLVPPTVIQIMPILQSLNVEQKLFIIKELLSDKMPSISNTDMTCEANQNENLAWEMGKDLFESYASGQSDLSTNAKTITKQKIRQKLPLCI